jgi:hypothetical protein
MTLSIFSPITRPSPALGAANPETVLELDAHGTLLERSPAGGSTSARNALLLFQLQAWGRTSGGWSVGMP